MVVSHHVRAGNWTQNPWKSSQCSYVWAIPPAPGLYFQQLEKKILREEMRMKMQTWTSTHHRAAFQITFNDLVLRLKLFTYLVCYAWVYEHHSSCVKGSLLLCGSWNQTRAFLLWGKHPDLLSQLLNSHVLCSTCFQIRSHYVALAALEFATYARLASKLQCSTCSCIRRAKINGLYLHIQPCLTFLIYR